MNNQTENLASLPKKDIHVNNFCAATFSISEGGDDLYYRSQILEKKSFGEYLIRFIDYGNSTIKHESKLRSLPPELCMLPPQAIRAMLPLSQEKFEKNNMHGYEK